MIKKIGTNVFAVFVIFIVLAIIIPLNNVAGGALLDFLLLMNISLSVVILLMTMYIKEPLEFSAFPTILLITTVFRLSLNISTTRGILSEGYAGSVIETFGSFVMGGDPVVGFIIFIIIVLVNFLVITKGSERVSEVAARFTLDAMPGKQMAIDADLNTGAITDEEAKIRRANIQRESDRRRSYRYDQRRGYQYGYVNLLSCHCGRRSLLPDSRTSDFRCNGYGGYPLRLHRQL